jgi:hypothetical protein
MSTPAQRDLLAEHKKYCRGARTTIYGMMQAAMLDTDMEKIAYIRGMLDACDKMLDHMQVLITAPPAPDPKKAIPASFEVIAQPAPALPTTTTG